MEVSVVDCGDGVREDLEESIFTPFSTTKESGMGMGLSISRSIITAHGGRLDYFNKERCGATFFFTLPIADDEIGNG
jgi:signal transduction histidine kinase